MGCGEFLVKYILFFANLFFALAGLALLGVGIAVQLQINVILQNIPDVSMQMAPITTMVVGGVIFLIAFYGCCGAIRESHCMLITYAIFMILMMVAKIALASIIFANLDGLKQEVIRNLNQLFNTNVNAFHEIEKAFSCCGPIGSVSYSNLLGNLPDSCCATPPCSLLNAFSGCNGKVNEFLNVYGLAVGGVAIIVASVELVAVVFSLCLANYSRNKARRAQY